MDVGTRRDDTDFELMMFLGRYHDHGIPIYFEGQESSPQEVVKYMTNRDDEVFMPDYVIDNDDNVVQIRYDHVK